MIQANRLAYNLVFIESPGSMLKSRWKDRDKGGGRTKAAEREAEKDERGVRGFARTMENRKLEPARRGARRVAASLHAERGSEMLFGGQL